MRLSQFSDYSLRVMLYLAEHPGVPRSVAEIAEWYGISKDHLVKVAHCLVKRGYARSVRGRNGGLVLGRPAAEISLAAIVRATEPDLAIVECFDPSTSRCRISRSCRLKHALHRAREAFFDVLEGQKLNALISNSKPHTEGEFHGVTL